jgi:hypothetical protein
VRAILRTHQTNFFSTIPLSQIDEPLIPYKVLRCVNPALGVKSLSPLIDLNV